ncbi:Glycoside hydrolase family 61 [Penicillium maclennaniae]|uniref:Glycoside hydrolase family 61 n=1 Tax=Penicillium maclennaniae TaxID=1343394 RepID=UPI00253FDDA5|nr:Glycoside hydrolase family 61 [Penicillium maclennaniae]KAJ5677342.1 Glycoside hydrolase family 61 [Penicillium maclennaniae]
MKSISIILAALSAVPLVSSHYFFPHFIANDNFTDYFEYVREDTQGYMPMKGQYSSDQFRCNTGSQDFASKTGVYTVKTGDTIGFGTDFNALIEHPGPLQVYMSKATGDVREYDGSGDWFKIYELVPAGQYLVRIEHIAIHGAMEWGGAELYFNCAQIEVESDGESTPGPTVKIPGVYDGYEPGIMFNMYRDSIVNYTMPGPRPFPDDAYPDVTASGISVAPSTAWTLPAVTRYPSPVISASTFQATSTPIPKETPSVTTASESSASFEKETTPTVEASARLSADSGVSVLATSAAPPVFEDCEPPVTVTVKTTVTVSNAPTCVPKTVTTTVTTTVFTTIA